MIYLKASAKNIEDYKNEEIGRTQFSLDCKAINYLSMNRGCELSLVLNGKNDLIVDTVPVDRWTVGNIGKRSYRQGITCERSNIKDAK